MSDNIPAEFEQLCSKYIEGTISLEEGKQLEQILESSEECVKVFVQNTRVHMNTNEALKELIQTGEIEVPKPSKKKYFNTWLAVAASLAIAAGLYFVTSGKAKIAQVTSVVEATIMRNGKSIPVTTDTMIQADDEINGALTFKYLTEETTVELAKDSKLILKVQEEAQRLYLDQGTLLANVAKQKTGKNLIIYTPHAESTVLGTILKISIEENHTRLDVEEGLVSFTRKSDGKEIKIKEGYSTFSNAKVLVPESTFTADFHSDLPLMQTPYFSDPANIPGRIEAENFDLGGLGVAYQASSAKSKNIYRKENIKITSINGEGNLVHLNKDEWLEYTLKSSGGDFNLNLRTSGLQNDIQLTLILDGKVLTTLSVPQGKLQSLNTKDLSIPEGVHILQVKTSDSIILNWLEFTKSK
ncbi:MAG: FecR domain-containing protein [Lentisphaeraceae bacterium]|nr:FecR domain-containing protein [Lentisphaeraceae bacterium]